MFDSAPKWLAWLFLRIFLYIDWGTMTCISLHIISFCTDSLCLKFQQGRRESKMTNLSSGYPWTMTLYSVASVTSLLFSSGRWLSVLGFCCSTQTPSLFGRHRSVLLLLILAEEGLPERVYLLGEVSVLSWRVGWIDIAAVSSASFADGLGPCSMASSLWSWEADDLCVQLCQTCPIATGQTSEKSCIVPGTPSLFQSNAVLWASCWRMWRQRVAAFHCRWVVRAPPWT